MGIWFCVLLYQMKHWFAKKQTKGADGGIIHLTESVSCGISSFISRYWYQDKCILWDLYKIFTARLLPGYVELTSKTSHPVPSIPSLEDIYTVEDLYCLSLLRWLRRTKRKTSRHILYRWQLIHTCYWYKIIIIIFWCQIHYFLNQKSKFYKIHIFYSLERVTFYTAW